MHAVALCVPLSLADSGRVILRCSRARDGGISCEGPCKYVSTDRLAEATEFSQIALDSPGQVRLR
jgi:hypothetical protein